MMKSKMNGCVSLLTLFAASFLMLPAKSADNDLKSVGQSVVNAYSDSVLYVAMTIEVQISVATQNQTTEGAVEVLGTVLNADGLIAVSNSAVDLSNQVREQLSRQVPAGTEIKVDSSVKSSKIIMPDGSEVDAEVVLQDADLDFAFLQAVASEDDDPLPVFLPAPIDSKASRLQPLDDIILLGRLSKSLNRAASVRAGRIESVIRRPRLLYRADLSGLGQPVFDKQGGLVGMFVRQTTGENAGSLIIRPVKDLLKISSQIGEGQAEK